MKNILLLALLSVTSGSIAQVDIGNINEESYPGLIDEFLPTCSSITSEGPSFPNHPPNITITQACGVTYSQCVSKLNSELNDLLNSGPVIIHSITRCR